MARRASFAYGADIHEDYNPEFLKEFGLEENGYYLLVARPEPENNIAMAIDGYPHPKRTGAGHWSLWENQYSSWQRAGGPVW